MAEEGKASRNLLAVGGVVTNTEGKVVEPPSGPLELPWLFEPTPERVRLAKKHLANNPELDDETRWGWFLSRGGPDWEALEHVTKRDWRMAVKCWSGDTTHNLHNRATLHRILFYSPDGGEKPEAQLRETLRLYHRLSQLEPSRKFYGDILPPLVKRLKAILPESYEANQLESFTRSLEVLRQVEGDEAAAALERKLLEPEFNEFLVLAASLQKELLPYQGQSYAPLAGELRSIGEELENSLVPRGERLKRLLREGTPQYKRIGPLIGQVCALLAQTCHKAEDDSSCARWLEEAKKWDAAAVKGWDQVAVQAIEEEETPIVAFPEKDLEEQVNPRSWGHRLFGVRARNLDWHHEVAREEWLESVLLFGIPVFPTGRYAAYKNLDTGEIGYYKKIDLLISDHIKQGLVVVVLTFALLLGVVRLVPDLLDPPPTPVERQATQSEITEAVERLKVLAQEEASLKGKGNQSARLKEIEQERAALIKKIRGLEKQ